MAKPIYRTKRVTEFKNGVKVRDEYVRERVKPAEIKKTIMAANNWNEDQYRKQYDIFKNKLRAFESYKQAHGVKVDPQSPLELLYKTARAKEKYGEAYTPSLQMQRIESFSAVSITQGRRLAMNKESEYSKRRAQTFAATTETAFKEFIAQVPQAAEIDRRIKDPVMKEEALKALAEHIKAKQAPSGEVFGNDNVGSDRAAEDFDINEWLE